MNLATRIAAQINLLEAEREGISAAFRQARTVEEMRLSARARWRNYKSLKVLKDYEKETLFCGLLARSESRD